MTIDEIVERAIPLRGIECATKKAEAVVRRRELKRAISLLILDAETNATYFKQKYMDSVKQ